MKKGNSKKSIESRVARITALAYRVTKQGKHHVFVNYSGHVNALNVQIFIGGWKAFTSCNHEWSLWINFSQDTFKTLSQIRAKLNSLLNERAEK